MNKLPQELIDRISSYLEREDLRNTLFISRQFQHAAEQYSAAFESYVLTESNADKFLETYSDRRFNYLRYLHFSTAFSDIGSQDDDEDVCRDDDTCREFVAEEREALDQEFTRQVNFLFSTVDAMEAQQSKVSGPGRIHLSIYTPKRFVNKAQFCLHYTFVSWRVDLLSPATLPQLSSIQHLSVLAPDQEFDSDGPDPALRMLDHRILFDLSTKLPNVYSMTCMVGGGEWHGSFRNDGLRHITRDWAGPRRDSRHDFGKALSEGALSTLRHVELDFLHPHDDTEYINQRRSLPNLVSPAAFDPFSTSLRLLSYQLRSMKLCVMADEALFWPTDKECSTPSWPNLQSINVMFHIAAPSGSWYFQGLHDVGSVKGFDVTDDMYPPLTTTDEDTNDCLEAMNTDWDLEKQPFQFRIKPDEELLVPFLTAFARALAHMPSLKDAALWSPLGFSSEPLEEPDECTDSECDQIDIFSDAGYGTSLAWGVAYRAPGEKAFDTRIGEDFCASRQLWWGVAKWRPDPDLHELFQQVGKDRHYGEMKEYWDSAGAEAALFDRDDFDNFPSMPEPPYVDLS